MGLVGALQSTGWTVADDFQRAALDGGLLIVIFSTSGALEAVATKRTQDSVRSLLDLAPERATRLRMVRAIKNRYGPADEVGCFALTGDGIIGLPDPSGLFLSRRPEPVAGTCVTVTVEGRRPMLAEVQALVATSQLQNPRRAVSGLDAGRVAMVLAIAERRAGVPLASKDVYTSTVGGIRVTEPATDLALALAINGAARDTALPTDLIALGELGLSGELRPVPDADQRGRFRLLA